MQNFAAIEAGIQHADTNGNLRIVFPFKLSNQVICIGNITGNYFGILPFVFRM
jgi:hypothetical protein